ncbi:MAG: phosphoribosylanthranilate isomerase [Lachnospiraceae bacterium]|nr:phosphoribosylanthranilate isomerase [Lachnospiraceae bacterium]
MSTKIKLCGLTRPEDISTAAILRPDYIGLVFARKSRRFVTRKHALELRKLLEKMQIKMYGVCSTYVVGVFVNEPVTGIARLLDNGTIDIAQLHGNEDEAYIASLRELTDKPIIQAFRIDTEADIKKACVSSADLILLDSGNGGTGTAFDWQLLAGANKDYILAGGLDPENVAEAIQKLHPYGVDVSSGIETDGLKDPGKMKEFVKAVKQAI